MAMKFLRESAKGGLGKFILVGFMGLAVGGLVLMDMGGFFRGGITHTDVAKIGRTKVSAPEFDRIVRRAISRLGISPQDAYKAGYVDQILKSEIRAQIMERASREHGIMVNGDIVTEHIRKLVAPMVEQNNNAKDIMQNILFNQGLSE